MSSNIADYLCEHGCENCQKYFDDGRDNCRTCGLDLNFANEEDEEDDEFIITVENFLKNQNQNYKVVKHQGESHISIYAEFNCNVLNKRYGCYSECGKCHAKYGCNVSSEFNNLCEKNGYAFEWVCSGVGGLFKQ